MNLKPVSNKFKTLLTILATASLFFIESSFAVKGPPTPEPYGPRTESQKEAEAKHFQNQVLTESLENQMFHIVKNHKIADRNSILQELINKGVKLNAVSESGLTAFHLAALYKNTEALVLLAKAGANVNAQVNESHKSYAGYTALHLASHTPNRAAAAFHQYFGIMTYEFIGDVEQTMQTLLELKSNASLSEKSGSTPLFTYLANMPTWLVNWETVKALVKAGADVRHKNNSGETILSLAIRSFAPIAACRLAFLK